MSYDKSKDLRNKINKALNALVDARRVLDEIDQIKEEFTYVRVTFPNCQKKYTYKVRGIAVVGDHLLVNTRRENDIIVRVAEIGDGGFTEAHGYIRIGKVIDTNKLKNVV